MQLTAALQLLQVGFLQQSGFDDEQNWMAMTPVFWIWNGILILLFFLIILKCSVSMHESFKLHTDVVGWELPGAAAVVCESQSHLSSSYL